MHVNTDHAILLIKVSMLIFIHVYIGNIYKLMFSGYARKTSAKIKYNTWHAKFISHTENTYAFSIISQTTMVPVL